jgi:hypothetical protein
MKKLLFLLVSFSFCSSLMAAEVSLAWDASLSSQVDGYMLFDRNFQKPYDFDNPSWTGTALEGKVIVADDRQSAFVARAFVWGVYDLNGVRLKNPSDNSNEVVFTPTAKPKPQAPRNLAIRILVAIGKFFKGLFG